MTYFIYHQYLQLYISKKLNDHLNVLSL